MHCSINVKHSKLLYPYKQNNFTYRFQQCGVYIQRLKNFRNVNHNLKGKYFISIHFGNNMCNSKRWYRYKENTLTYLFSDNNFSDNKYFFFKVKF